MLEHKSSLSAITLDHGHTALSEQSCSNFVQAIIAKMSEEMGRIWSFAVARQLDITPDLSNDEFVFF